jgi:hypothetical protein
MSKVEYFMGLGSNVETAFFLLQCEMVAIAMRKNNLAMHCHSIDRVTRCHDL